MKNLSSPFLKNTISCLSLLLIVSLLSQTISLAQEENPAGEPVVEKTEEEIASENKNKELEERAKTDTYNLNYYPKLQMGTVNLFTGAATLKGNEVFARLGLVSFFPDTITGQAATATSAASYLTPTVSVGWGIIDNLFFSATVPYRFYLSGQGNGLSDPWLSLKWRLLNDPLIFSLQLDGKLPLGNAQKIPPFGEGQADADIMAMLTKSFDPIYIQAGAGFKYKLPRTVEQNKVLSTVSYAFQIPYVLDIGGHLPNFKNLGLNIAAYGYYSTGSGQASSNLLSILPNISYKVANYDFNLSFNKIIFGTNIDTGWGVHGGVSIKNSFEYPRIFNLLLLKKIDPEDLDKKKDLRTFDEGKKLYINNCSKCHILISPDALPEGEEWEPIVDRYRERRLISKTEYNAIVDFLEAYTKDDAEAPVNPETKTQ